MTPSSDLPNQPARLLVVEHVYHQRPGQQPTEVGHRYGRLLAGKDEPYCREVTVGPDWQSLETYWVKAASLLVLRNDEGRFAQAVPTPEERAAALARVVEVSFLPAAREAGRTMHSPPPAEPETHVLVRPGEDARFEPAAVGQLRVRCRSGTARCFLSAYPA